MKTPASGTLRSLGVAIKTSAERRLGKPLLWTYFDLAMVGLIGIVASLVAMHF